MLNSVPSPDVDTYSYRHRTLGSKAVWGKPPARGSTAALRPNQNGDGYKANEDCYLWLLLQCDRAVSAFPETG